MENCVTIPAREYEELIRDQTRLEIITQMISGGTMASAQMINIICGLRPKTAPTIMDNH